MNDPPVLEAAGIAKSYRTADRVLEVLKGLGLGASAYVTKPFGNAEILEAIRAVLDPRA